MSTLEIGRTMTKKTGKRARATKRTSRKKRSSRYVYWFGDGTADGDPVGATRGRLPAQSLASRTRILRAPRRATLGSTYYDFLEGPEQRAHLLGPSQ